MGIFGVSEHKLDSELQHNNNKNILFINTYNCLVITLDGCKSQWLNSWHRSAWVLYRFYASAGRSWKERILGLVRLWEYSYFVG